MRLLASLEAFVQLARLQNFGRAAKSLGITTPTLSRRMAALEHELGCTLIQRSTRTFALTDSGARLLERATKLVNEASYLQQEISADFLKMAGHLRVGAPVDLTISVLAPLFAQFCLTNRELSLEMVATAGQPDLQRDRLDVAFVVVHQNLLRSSQQALHRIGSFARMAYASRRYLSRYGAPETPQSLKQHTCIRHLQDAPETQWELRRGAKRMQVPVHGGCCTNSVIAASEAARNHLGIAMLPQHLACHPALGAGLTRVLPEWEGAPAIVFALTADRHMPARTTELIRFTRAAFTKRISRLDAAGRTETRARAGRTMTT